MAAKKKPAASQISRATAPKVFDVAKPGKTSANSTAKPIIVTNHPVIQDPMVTEPKVDEPTGAPLLKSPPKKLVIQPIHEDLEASETAPAAQTVKITPVEPAGEETVEPVEVSVEVPETQAEAAPPEVEASASEPETIAFTQTTVGTPTKNPEVADNQLKPATPVSETERPVAVPSASRDDKQLTPEQSEAALKAARERAAELQAIVDKQQYFLPIKTVEQRRSRRFAIFGVLLIIVLAVAWYDVALDAGLVSNPHNFPHTHFFVAK